MPSWPLLTDTRRAIDTLESGVQELAAAFDPPILTGKPGFEWWQYEHPSGELIVLLKAVRVVSGLNALLVLLEAGYTQEVGVLLRTVDDFVDEITFLLEAYDRDENTASQVKFVQDFFAEEIPLSAGLRQEKTRTDRVKRRQIQAGQARYLQPDNPDRVRKIVNAIDGVYSGYIHGGYPHIMEMYHGGDRPFEMRGMRKTVRISEYQKQIAAYVHRALAVLAVFAAIRGMESLHGRLKSAAKRFLDSPEYRKE
ncbi:MAG TPA: hypothetical protein VGO40_06780 [Longimicrobium sp.]|jgi:hypothetical protein|nr:hypothetical protein [Longimicrobium sp.]